MKKIEGIDKPILDVEGATVQGQAQVLGNGTVIPGKPVTPKSLMTQCLSRGQSEGQEVRAMLVAMQIHQAKGSVELEDADFAILKDVVSKDRLLNNLAKAAVLTVLEVEKKEK